MLNYQYDPVNRLSSISETAGGQTWTAASANHNSASLITSLVYGPSGSHRHPPVTPPAPDDDPPLGPAGSNPTYGAYMTCMVGAAVAGIHNVGPALTLAGVEFATRGLLPKLGFTAGVAGTASALYGTVVVQVAVAAAGQQCSQQTGYVPLGVQVFGSGANQ